MTTSAIPTGLDHLGLIVRSVDAAKAFLGDVLGLELLKETNFPERGTRAAFFRCGSSEIEVIECMREDVRKVRLGDEEARIEHIAVQVPELKALIDHLGARDGKMDADPIVYDGDLMSFSVPATTMGVRFQFMEKDVEPSDSAASA